MIGRLIAFWRSRRSNATGAKRRSALPIATSVETVASRTTPSAKPKLRVSPLRTVFGSADELASKVILSALHAIEEAPWTNLKGKPLDERGLAHRLRQYGIKSKTIRIGAGPSGTLKGYTRIDFTDAWERYLPGASPARSVTSVTSSENQPVIVTDVSDVSDPASATDVSDVTLVSDAVSDGHEEKPSEFNLVSDVTDVTDFPGGGETCAQCGHGGDLKEVWYGELTAQVHAHCQDARVAAQDDDLSIPSYLDRRGELSS